MSILNNFQSPIRVIIFGTSGGIGQAVTQQLADDPHVEKVYCVAREIPDQSLAKCAYFTADITIEDDLREIASLIKKDEPVHLVLVLTGFLHGADISPEKSARQLNMAAFEKNFAVNCFGPTLVAKHLLPLMPRNGKSVFAALSARVGSISDNRLGGWYSYRASKAALNMMIRTLAIEYSRSRKDMVILGLHPGTVDTRLSAPFQGNVPEGKLFTPEYCAEKLLAVINEATPENSGDVLAWDGTKVPA